MDVLMWPDWLRWEWFSCHHCHLLLPRSLNLCPNRSRRCETTHHDNLYLNCLHKWNHRKTKGAKKLAHSIDSRSRVLLASAVTFDPCFSDVLAICVGNATSCVVTREQLCSHDEIKMIMRMQIIVVGLTKIWK